MVQGAIPVPGLEASADPRWERSRLRVLFPQLPSSMVGIGLNEKETDSREIWDLARLQKVGVVSNLPLEGSQLMALGPDGHYFAAKPQFDDVIDIVDVTSGKIVKKLSLGGFRIDVLAFSAADQLLLAESGRLRMYSIPDGTPGREIRIDNWVARDGGELSPGGKQFAALMRDGSDRNAVALFDLASGDRIGDLTLGATSGDCLGIAFSSDGRSLAALMNRDESLTLEVIDLTAPGLVSTASLDGGDVAAPEGYQGRAVEWLPDGRRVLIAGRAVVDAQAGTVEKRLMNEGPYAVRPLGARFAVGVQGQALTATAIGGSSVPSVAAATTHESDANAANATTAAPPAAGEAGSALPLTAADRSSAREIDPLTSAGWDIRLGAPPHYKEALNTSGFKVPGGFIQQVVLSTTDPPMAVINYASAPLTGGAARTAKTWVDAANLMTGEFKNRVDFPAPSVVTGVSPDGRFVAVRSAAADGRVDVFSLQSDQHIAGFRPAGPSAVDVDPWFVDFVDADHLLVAIDGELSLWKLPECEALYTMPIGPARPAFTPGREYVAVAAPDDSRWIILESAAGVIRGTLATPNRGSERLAAAAFHQRGRWLACLSSSAAGGELIVVDTASGQESARALLPVSGEVLQWCGDDYLLLDGSSLISLPAESVVWTYQLPVGIHCREPIDGRHWYIAAVAPADRNFVLLGVEIPEDMALRKIEQAGRSAPVFKPGDAIRLDIEADTSGPKSIGTLIAQNLIKRYADVGSAISPNASAVLTVRPYSHTARRDSARTSQPSSSSVPDLLTLGTSERDLLTRTNQSSRGPGENGAPSSSAAPPSPPPSNVWELSLSVAGQQVWRTWLKADPGGAVLEWDESQAAAGVSTDHNSVRMAAAALLAFDPPKFGFQRGASEGAGISSLTTRGPQRLPK